MGGAPVGSRPMDAWRWPASGKCPDPLENASRAAELGNCRISSGINACSHRVAQPIRSVEDSRRGVYSAIATRLGLSCVAIGKHSRHHPANARTTCARALPTTVLDTLRTWADKRERLQVYTSAALFEFNSTDELDAALGRGLPGIRLAERILLVPNERLIDYRHFRLIGTRDYSLPPDQCVEIDGDGITLTIDPARSDLLLETEMHRFAEPVDRPGINGRRQYRLTPTSLKSGRERGVNIPMLEAWFDKRVGRPLSPAARLLLTGPLMQPCRFKRPLVLQVETSGLADGLMQWPGTRSLIHSRLGPTALVVPEENVPTLRERLRELGLNCDELNHEHSA